MRPRWPDAGGSAADLSACRRMLAGGSRTFFAASWVLPPDVARAATALYAFCRVADDAVDVDAGGAAAVEALRERLDAAYAGRPCDVVADRAFAAVAARYAIPRALPEALLEGFAWDVERRQYDDMPALLDYAARVAGTVGAMMALIMGVRDRAALARACDLGVAMQLTNIARDVGADACLGRLYLPRDWMREAGIDPDAWMRTPHFVPALGSVIARVLEVAESRYRRAADGIARLPRACRPGIHAARLLYAEIGREVERNRGDSVHRRAVVPGRRKLRLLGSAIVAAGLHRARYAADEVAAESRFLVDAAAGETPPWLRPDPGAGEWLLDLFERLERRDRASGASPAWGA
ncbi:MAG TPA: phytoene/squalene synthase family protein [Burkholderiaceae bacterium]|nr:phytoene/squalene synthase family protein [Burkholderiaceae bacterium]